MAEFFQMQAPLAIHGSVEEHRALLDNTFYARRLRPLCWDIVPRSPDFTPLIGAPATKQTRFPVELWTKIVGFIEPGLEETILNLRMVCREAKAAVDFKLFRVVHFTLSEIKRLAGIHVDTQGMFRNTQIVVIESVRSFSTALASTSD